MTYEVGESALGTLKGSWVSDFLSGRPSEILLRVKIDPSKTWYSPQFIKLIIGEKGNGLRCQMTLTQTKWSQKGVGLCHRPWMINEVFI